MSIKKTILKLNLSLNRLDLTKSTQKIGCSFLVERELQSIFLVLFNILMAHVLLSIIITAFTSESTFSI
jgi:hypothetical protein